MKKRLWELLSMLKMDYYCPLSLGILPIGNIDQCCLMAVKRCLQQLPERIPDLLGDLDEVTQLGHTPCLVFQKESNGYDLKLVISHIDEA